MNDKRQYVGWEPEAHEPPKGSQEGEQKPKEFLRQVWNEQPISVRAAKAVKQLRAWCDCEGKGCNLCSIAELITTLLQPPSPSPAREPFEDRWRTNHDIDAMHKDYRDELLSEKGKQLMNDPKAEPMTAREPLRVTRGNAYWWRRELRQRAALAGAPPAEGGK